MQKEKLSFTYKDVEFLIEIEYADEPIGNLIHKQAYCIRVITPESEEFSRKIVPPSGMNLVVFNDFKNKLKYYFNKDLNDNDCYNLYYQAIFMSVDWYFNKDNPKLSEILNKIQKLNDCLHNRYDKQILSLKEQKRALKKELKTNKLSNKEYQKKLTPINRKIGDLEYKISSTTQNYRRKFFKCCDLKDEYKQEVFDIKKVVINTQ